MHEPGTCRARNAENSLNSNLCLFASNDCLQKSKARALSAGFADGLGKGMSDNCICCAERPRGAKNKDVAATLAGVIVKRMEVSDEHLSSNTHRITGSVRGSEPCNGGNG